MWDAVFPYLAALLPTVAVGVLFYFLIKTILEGDRRERLAQSKWEKEHDKPRAPDTPEKSP
jgi:hypothetical protein